jgi:hypothetical protein
MLVEDAGNWQQVEAVLAKINKTWDYVMHTKSDAMHCRVQHFHPPSDILVPQLKTLIAGWQDAKYSLDPSCGPFFSTALVNKQCH